MGDDGSENKICAQKIRKNFTTLGRPKSPSFLRLDLRSSNDKSIDRGPQAGYSKKIPTANRHRALKHNMVRQKKKRAKCTSLLAIFVDRYKVFFAVLLHACSLVACMLQSSCPGFSYRFSKSCVDFEPGVGVAVKVRRAAVFRGRSCKRTPSRRPPQKG